MMEPLPEGWDPAVPFPRARTRIVVADPTGERETISLNLRGNFEPEAFSTNDDQLFLIQHLPAETPSAYRVTVLDLVREKLLPVFGPFKGPAERMPGTRLSQLLSPDADQLYTLYTSSRPGYAPHGAPVANDAAVSFVHVLSLRDGWAHCVGLPRSMWDRPSSEQAMATTPDGNYLLVVDAGRGIVAALHTESLKVRTSPIDLSGEGDIARTAAHVSPDGRTLLVSVAGAEGSVVTAFDARTFEVIDTWRLEGIVSGLDFSSDSSSVYAAMQGQVVVLDARDGLEIGAVPVPTDDTVVRVTALAG
jgi:DNA-binding beta-propeller fold protein YncE